MDQLKSIVRTYLSTGSIKATARRLQISKNTVRQYIRRGQSYDADLSKLFSLPDIELRSLFYPNDGKTASEREQTFDGKVDHWVKELRRVGVTKQLLWEDYRKGHPDGYGYSQFCGRLKNAIGRKDLTLNLIHVPGEVMQVDFAGKKMHWVDLGSGEVHGCQVLIAVLPHSQYTFAVALESQKVTDFIHGLNQAFLFFGCLPKVVLSDNLKSFVTRPDRYEPRFNDLCVQLAVHYQIDLRATRVARPKDKASVENAVRTAYSRIYAPLRDGVFHSMEALNQAVREQLSLHNNRPFQKRPGSRQDIFQQFERPVMGDLPTDLFELKKTTTAKVQRNYHVFLGEEKNYYSVPFRYVGKSTTVIYTSKTVEVYLDSQRIAIHVRLPGRSTYMHQTEEAHMPRSHREWREAQGYDAAYFLAQAEKVGAATKWAVGQVLTSRVHEAQSFNSCKGILQLEKKYSGERLEKACLRCQNGGGKANYSMLKRILSRNLDQLDEAPGLFSPPAHGNIRGAGAYQ